MKNKIRLLGIIWLSLCLLFSQVLLVSAATIFPSPNSGTYNIGKSFAVGLFVSSADQALNAISGSLSFPNDKLEVSSISKAGSIVSLWVQQPSYSNSAGTINFEGIVLNPGFTGSSGRVLTVNFKTKNGGSAPLTFSSGSVLANDGQGTNILSGLGSARFDIEVPISGPAAPDAETPSDIIGTPPGPNVTSPTHENSDKWYNNSQPQLNWALATGITAVRLLVGVKPQVDPTVVYSPPISSRTLDQLDDGIWYFHVQLKNTAGWGGITHFRLQIDTQNPEFFNISEVARQDLTEPIAKFIFESTDATSGIDHYETQIDDNESLTWKDDGTGIYSTPTLRPGKHRLMAKAVDAAGNNIANFAEFEIKPLDLPQLDTVTKDLSTTEHFRVTGKTYPNAQVVFELQKPGEETILLTTNANAQGVFEMISEEPLAEGEYIMRAKVLDSRGAQSFWTADLEIKVQKSAFWRIGSLAISVLSVIIPLLALVVLLGLMLWYSWYKFKVLRKRVSKEVGEAEVALKVSFDNLRLNLAERIKSLEQAGSKRALTTAEKRLVKQLKDDLTAAEKSVRKEIQDIAKEVK